MTPAVKFAPPDAKPVKENERKKIESSAGHHFNWQLVNDLQKRDAGAIFLSFSLSLLCCRQLVPFQKKKKKTHFLEVMDFSGAGISGMVVYQSVSLHASSAR